MTALLKIPRLLSHGVDSLSFSEPVCYVYNPLDYASKVVELYLRRYAKLGATNLLLGMNPGPFGMAQNGVPFGDTRVCIRLAWT